MSEQTNPVSTEVHRTIRVILMMLLGAAILTLLPTPSYGRVNHAFNDFLHAPAYAVMALMVGWLVLKWKTNHRYLAITFCWLAVLAVSLLLEWLQRFTQTRVPSREDAIANTIGVTAGILLISGLQLFLTKRVRFASIALAFVLVIFGTYQPGLILFDYAMTMWQFPKLGSFERQSELKHWYSAGNSVISRDSQHFRDGKWSLRVDLLPGRYTGAVMAVPPRDWSPYEELHIDLYLEKGILEGGLETLNIVIKIFDRFHNHHWYDDRFHRKVTLRPGWQRIKIPISLIETAPRNRVMPLDKVAAIQLFSVDLPSKCTFFIDDIRLVNASRSSD